MVFRERNWSTTLIPPSNQGKQGLCQKKTKKDARQESAGQGAQSEASKTSLRAPKVVYGREKWSTATKGGLQDLCVHLDQGNKAWSENQAKRRTLSGPETRRTAEDFENQKLVSKREKWSTTTKRWSTDHSLPPGKRNKAWSANRANA